MYVSKKKPKLNKFSFRNALIGTISGIILYSLFYVGFTLFKPYVSAGALNVYRFRTEISLIIPGFLLLITSFCEELFWRAYIQKQLIKSYRKNGILFASLLYALIHLPTLNFPLMIAALIAGLYWGILYNYTSSLWVVVFSHIIWTELIFVFLPLT
jgi:membrane protease YdiL (CAAX protease family)